MQFIYFYLTHICAHTRERYFFKKSHEFRLCLTASSYIDLNLNEVKEEEEVTISAWEFLHIKNINTWAKVWRSIFHFRVLYVHSYIRARPHSVQLSSSHIFSLNSVFIAQKKVVSKKKKKCFHDIRDQLQ